jgi:hypothetical protein
MARYGIEGIAQTYEDPFGVAKIDINMDDIVEDARREVEVMLLAWQTQGTRGGMFRPYPRDSVTSETSSEYFSNDGNNPEHSLLRVVVSDLSHQIESDAAERERQRMSGTSTASTTRDIRSTENGSGSVQFAVEETTPLLRTFDPRKESAVSLGAVVRKDYMSIGAGNVQDRVEAGDSSGPRISWSDSIPG